MSSDAVDQWHVGMQGKLTMMGCYASNNHGAGYGLHNGGTLEVKNSRSYMDSVGVGGARGKLYAEGVVVKNARDNGFEISSECHAVLRSCTSHDAGTLEKGSGLAVSDEGTVVEAHDCEFVAAGAVHCFFCFLRYLKECITPNSRCSSGVLVLKPLQYSEIVSRSIQYGITVF